MFQFLNLPGVLCELVPLLVLLAVATRIGRQVPRAGVALFVGGVMLTIAVAAPVLLDAALAGIIPASGLAGTSPTWSLVWIVSGMLTGIARPVGMSLGLALVCVAGWFVLGARAVDDDVATEHDAPDDGVQGEEGRA